MNVWDEMIAVCCHTVASVGGESCHAGMGRTRVALVGALAVVLCITATFRGAHMTQSGAIALSGFAKPSVFGAGPTAADPDDPTGDDESARVSVESTARPLPKHSLAEDTSTVALTTANQRTMPPSRKPGKGNVDWSHMGLVPSSEGINHAWEATDPNRCHGARAYAQCVSRDTIEYLRKNVLMAIVTGREDTFRVEVSQCTWLSHFPTENAYVFSDVVPEAPRTPQQWVRGDLPAGVVERDGDLFSDHIAKGYVKAVRSAGQGYSASWIVAQFRFPQALQVLADRMQRESDLQWALLIDDDTVVNFDALVKRLKELDPKEPHYLSRKGWGGAGHLYSREAMQRVHARISECIDKWMVRQFKASDAMLLKCADHLRLKQHLEATMTHCPASHLREAGLMNKNLATLHAKKDMYPPILLATWRSALYYLASSCQSAAAASLAVEFSACAFGSCKSAHCTKAHDDERLQKWTSLSRNNTLHTLPLPVVNAG
jgi:hypothetical protein